MGVYTLHRKFSFTNKVLNYRTAFPGITSVHKVLLVNNIIYATAHYVTGGYDVLIINEYGTSSFATYKHTNDESIIAIGIDTDSRYAYISAHYL